MSDIVSQQGEMHAAFVISTQANATIDKIDHTEALVRMQEEDKYFYSH